MKKKYFFFDYDGTLAIPLTREIPESARRTLQKLEADGHFVALATGRLQANAIDFVSSIGMKNVIADGGCSVTIDGELRWMVPLELDPVITLLKRLDEQEIPWAVTTENELIRYTATPNFDEFSRDSYVPTKYVPNLKAEDLTQVYKAYIPCAPGLEDQWEAKGLISDIPWIRYGNTCIFVEAMDKQRGIKKALDLFGAAYEDAVVFGDNKNDLSMFLPEWTSIAMGNAIPELKECATYITDTCDNDGIEKACRHFGWID